MLEQAEPWDEGELDLINAGKAEGPPDSSLGSLYSALGLDPVQGLPSEEGLSSEGGQPGAASEAPLAPSSGIFARPAVLAGTGAVVVALALMPTWPKLFGNEPAASLSENTATSVAPEKGQGFAEKVADLQPAERAPVEKATTADKDPKSLASPAHKSKKAPLAQTGEKKTTQPEKSKGPSLADEIALLKKARGLMASGDWSAAQAALTQHRKQFVPARLSAEARVIRVEILLKTGKRAEASRAAAPLMKKNSPYRARMETLLSSQ